VGEFGEVLVMDWGLARRLDVAAALEPGDERALGAGSPVMTQYGDVLGTPAYMSPEQARGDTQRHGPWSDVYALGALRSPLLAGRPPYTRDRGNVLHQLLAGPPAPVAEAAGSGAPVPPELAEACAHAMRHEIEARYPSAERLAEDVVAWLDG